MESQKVILKNVAYHVYLKPSVYNSGQSYLTYSSFQYFENIFNQIVNSNLKEYYPYKDELSLEFLSFFEIKNIKLSLVNVVKKPYALISYYGDSIEYPRYNRKQDILFRYNFSKEVIDNAFILESNISQNNYHLFGVEITSKFIVDIEFDILFKKDVFDNNMCAFVFEFLFNSPKSFFGDLLNGNDFYLDDGIKKNYTVTSYDILIKQYNPFVNFAINSSKYMSSNLQLQPFEISKTNKKIVNENSTTEDLYNLLGLKNYTFDLIKSRNKSKKTLSLTIKLFDVIFYVFSFPFSKMNPNSISMYISNLQIINRNITYQNKIAEEEGKSFIKNYSFHAVSTFGYDAEKAYEVIYEKSPFLNISIDLEKYKNLGLNDYFFDKGKSKYMQGQGFMVTEPVKFIYVNDFRKMFENCTKLIELFLYFIHRETFLNMYQYESRPNKIEDFDKDVVSFLFYILKECNHFFYRLYKEDKLSFKFENEIKKDSPVLIKATEINFILKVLLNTNKNCLFHFDKEIENPKDDYIFNGYKSGLSINGLYFDFHSDYFINWQPTYKLRNTDTSFFNKISDFSDDFFNNIIPSSLKANNYAFSYYNNMAVLNFYRLIFDQNDKKISYQNCQVNKGDIIKGELISIILQLIVRLNLYYVLLGDVYASSDSVVFKRNELFNISQSFFDEVKNISVLTSDRIRPRLEGKEIKASTFIEIEKSTQAILSFYKKFFEYAETSLEEFESKNLSLVFEFKRKNIVLEKPRLLSNFWGGYGIYQKKYRFCQLIQPLDPYLDTILEYTIVTTLYFDVFKGKFIYKAPTDPKTNTFIETDNLSPYRREITLEQYIEECYYQLSKSNNDISNFYNTSHTIDTSYPENKFFSFMQPSNFDEGVYEKIIETRQKLLLYYKSSEIKFKVLEVTPNYEEIEILKSKGKPIYYDAYLHTSPSSLDYYNMDRPFDRKVTGSEYFYPVIYKILLYGEKE